MLQYVWKIAREQVAKSRVFKGEDLRVLIYDVLLY